MKKLFFISMVCILANLPANASITVEQATSPEILRANGYSIQTTELVNVGKARATGQEYYSPGELAVKNQNKFTKFWRKLYVYTDPSQEDYSFNHHDIKETPSYQDL